MTFILSPDEVFGALQVQKLAHHLGGLLRRYLQGRGKRGREGEERESDEKGMEKVRSWVR